MKRTLIISIAAAALIGNTAAFAEEAVASPTQTETVTDERRAERLAAKEEKLAARKQAREQRLEAKRGKKTALDALKEKRIAVKETADKDERKALLDEIDAELKRITGKE